MIIEIIGIGLGTMKFIELEQEALERIGLTGQRRWWKSFLTCAFAGGMSVLLISGWRQQVLVGLGASGIAALFHAVDSCLRVLRDERMSHQLRSQQGRSRNF